MLSSLNLLFLNKRELGSPPAYDSPHPGFRVHTKNKRAVADIRNQSLRLVKISMREFIVYSFACSSTLALGPLRHTPLYRHRGFRPQAKRIGNSTPSPRTKSHSAGAGVPIGRVRRASRAAMRGSSKSHSARRRSNTRNTTAVTAP